MATSISDISDDSRSPKGRGRSPKEPDVGFDEYGNEEYTSGSDKVDEESDSDSGDVS